MEQVLQGSKKYKKKTCIRFIICYFCLNAILSWCLGFSYLKAIFSNQSLYANSIVQYSSILPKVLISSFALINFLSYMMLLAMIPALPLLLLAYFYPNKKILTSASVLCATTLAIFWVGDTRIFEMFKFHINREVIALIFQPNWREFFDLSLYELKLIAAVIIGLILLESIFAKMVWKLIVIPNKLHFEKLWLITGFISLSGCYMVLLTTLYLNNNILTQQTPNLPFYNTMLALAIPDSKAKTIVYNYSELLFSQPIFSNAPLNYPLHPMHCNAPQDKPYNIIMIMVDSLRFDALQYMPHVQAFADKHALQFTHHLSGGNSTQAGLVSLFYSLPRNYWTAMENQHNPPVFIDQLLKDHYTTRVIWSMPIRPPAYDQTIYLGLPDINLDGPPGDDIAAWDHHTTTEAIQFLKQKRQQPFFLNLFYNAPHAYCREQHFPQPHQPALPACDRITMSNDIDPLPYYNRYLNAVNYIDLESHQLLDAIQRLGYLQNSIVIFTSDHGQAFNENHQNEWGHSGNFTDAQVRVPFFVAWPHKKPKKINYLTNHYDVIPTLMKDVFGCDNPPGDYSIGQNLSDSLHRPPFILAGSYIHMCIIEPDKLTILESSGNFRVTTPEGIPNPALKTRQENILQALQMMRRFFKNS